MFLLCTFYDLLLQVTVKYGGDMGTIQQAFMTDEVMQRFCRGLVNKATPSGLIATLFADDRFKQAACDHICKELCKER